jgi:phage FluMu protein Com
MKTKLKQDKYRKARGGYSRLLEIRCEKCDEVLAHYQKDGPGPLKRMYIDRISSPKKLTDAKGNLTCPHCKQLIGIAYIYPKEKRPAFRLFEGSVTKKIIKN